MEQACFRKCSVQRIDLVGDRWARGPIDYSAGTDGFSQSCSLLRHSKGTRSNHSEHLGTESGTAPLVGREVPGLPVADDV